MDQLIEDIPLGSGYYNVYKKLEPLPINKIPIKEREEYLKRLVANNNIHQCALCQGPELFKYYDSSLDIFYVRCYNVIPSVFKELDSMCKGIEYKPSTRSKNNGILPLSQTVKTTEEYVEKIQDSLCGWHISF